MIPTSTKPERRHDTFRDLPQDFIDEVMPNEGHQESFALGLKEALRVIVEYLPEGAIQEIRSCLVVIRGNFEGLSDSIHLEITRPAVGLARVAVRPSTVRC
jgi:hypothetical protein